MWIAIAAVIALISAAVVPAWRGDLYLPRASRIKTLLDVRASEHLSPNSAALLDHMIDLEVEDFELRYTSRDVVQALRTQRLDRWDRMLTLWAYIAWVPFVAGLALANMDIETRVMWTVGDVAFPRRWVIEPVLIVAAWAIGRLVARRVVYSSFKEKRRNSVIPGRSRGVTQQ